MSLLRSLRPRAFARFACLALLLTLPHTLRTGDTPLRSPAPLVPLPVDESRSAQTRRLAKPVLASRVLDEIESTNQWHITGPGEMQLTSDRARQGRHSLRLLSPTKTPQPGPVAGRPFAETSLQRDFASEDWSAFNRLSVWVYPDLPGFRVVSLLVKLQSEGTRGRRYTHGGLHYVILRNHEWNHVAWEIPHLERRQVQGIELIYRLQGHEPGATDRVSFDFDQLTLEQVEPDPFVGWPLPPGTLAYSHLGFAPVDPKILLAPAQLADRFALLSATSDTIVHEAATTQSTAPTGVYTVCDFSSFQQPGHYRLRVGPHTTPPFPIHSDRWRSTILPVLNFYYAERCGWEVPGIHDICHRDWQGRHGDQRLIINGGWHDAGDLSQGLVNTAEAAHAMLELAETLRPSDPNLARHLLDEAKWGLDWILKTRFGNGHRVTWATMDFWTDGILGTADDVVVEAPHAPFDNFTGAAAAARAGRLYRGIDPFFATRCFHAAVADYDFAMTKAENLNVELAAAGLTAALDLRETTGRTDYTDHAFRFARLLTDAQDRVVRPWPLPLRGFLYASPRRDRILHYPHRSHEQAPIVGLARLCRLHPEHPDWMAWYATVALYSEFLRAGAEATAPYHMLPAGVYRLSQTRERDDRNQVQQGLRLDEDSFLRRFPVWGDMRGNLGVLLSQTRALTAAAQLRHQPALRQLAELQLEWTLGRNPFGQSLLHGVGHNYAPQYTALSGDIVGSLPVGIQTMLDQDTPYYPASNCYNYSEVWVHPCTRWLAILSDLLAQPALPAPSASSSEASKLECQPSDNGQITVRLRRPEADPERFALRVWNLLGDTSPQPLARNSDGTFTTEWTLRPARSDEAWVIVAFPENDPRHPLACDLVGP